jgi:phenylalanyl-tRNA synthetase beta chain
MNISLNWLKEYVNIDKNITEIVDALTMSGSKVEKYIKFGEKTKLVYTGKVLSIEKLNDKTNKVLLEIGEKIYTAVAKIPDIEIGDVVPVAMENACILNKEVKKGIVEGIESECMICHINDLGLAKELFPLVKQSGLITFPKNIDTGKDVSELLGLGDYIIEFEITPNRTDCMSVEGIARELAATFNLELKELYQDKSINYNIVDNVDGLKVNIESKNCTKYLLSVINNIEVKESDFEIQLKLIKSGINPINNIVDITNYIMLELGQPLHAFDKEKLKGNVIVKQSKNDNVITLDNQTRILDDNDLVISDNEKVIAIAGVMGCLNSGISNSTNTIVIESANFVRGSIRNTSKKLNLRTDASSKYEKGLAPKLTEHAMSRFLNLLNSYNIGNVTNNVVCVDNSNYVENLIKVDYDKINRIIGLDLSETEINNILESLNIKIKDKMAIIPYYRHDITITEDLAEEIARIYGYDKLPSKLPSTELTFGRKTEFQKYVDDLKDIMVNFSYNEIYTYTFFSEDTLKRCVIDKNSKLYDLVKLRNPLSIDFEYMRTTTVPHMLEALERNNRYKNKDVKLFEIGKIFLNANNISKNELCDEINILTIGTYGKNYDFYTIKKIVTNILDKYKIKYDISRSKSELMHPGVSCDILVGNEIIASIGKVNPKILINYDLIENTYIATIEIEKLFKYINNDIKYIELPKYPSVERDIAFIVDSKILSSDIIKEIIEINKDIVENVELFDVYESEQIGKNNKSLAYSVKLRSLDHTLNEKEITDFMDNLIQMLDNKFNAKIRS